MITLEFKKSNCAYSAEKRVNRYDLRKIADKERFAKDIKKLDEIYQKDKRVDNWYFVKRNRKTLYQNQILN